MNSDVVMENAAENFVVTIGDFIKNRKLMMDMNWPFASIIAGSRSLETIDGQAVISINGVLTKNLEFFGDFEQVSYAEIENEISALMDNPNIKTILLDINSPGGDVNGLFELCDYINECKTKKHFIAFANDGAFSAAYALASCCHEIYCSTTGGVGSIGVICQHADYSKAEEKVGIKVTPIFAGARKNDLSPHAPLSDEAIASLQEEVDRLYGMFVDLVASNRRISKEFVKATEARTYFGDKAREAGLVDGIYDFKGLMNFLRSRKMETETEAETEEMAISLEAEAEPKSDGLANYREKVLAISKLCRIARSERLAEFLEQDLDVESVKAELLKDAQKSVDIKNSMDRAAVENPLIVNARQLREGRK